MTQDEFDWKTGRVTYWALDQVDPELPLFGQQDQLKEDLAQARFGEATLIDIGWYPELAADGSFVVTVVVDEDWDRPLFRADAKTIGSLRDAVANAIEVAHRSGTGGD